MKQIMLTSIIAVLCAAEVFPQSGKCSDCIVWNKDRRLSWADFKHSPNRLSRNEALTDSGMEIIMTCEDGRPVVHITGYFNPHTSWTKDTESAYLLSHEQLHFDITELFVRRLRKRLSSLGNDCFAVSNQIQRFYDRNYKAFVDYQARYDRASRHSQDHSQQKFWQEKVQRELDALNHWAADR